MAESEVSPMNERDESNSENVIQSVETGIKIIELLKELNRATLTEIANQTEHSKATVYKHLYTLSQNNYVVKKGNEYRLGFQFLNIGSHLRSELVPVSKIKPTIQQLATETKEVCSFSIKENDRAVTLFRESGSLGVQTRTRVGQSLHLHQTAGGKAFLAHMPEEEVRALAERTGLPAAGENTITDIDTLLEELAEIHERGYALNIGESTKGVVAIAAPVIPRNQVLGVCAVVGPRQRMKGEHLEKDIPETLLSSVNALELDIAHKGV